jgi:hypothetical protein
MFNQMRFNNHWVTNNANKTKCGFCEASIKHTRELTKEGRVWRCECGASYIYPNRTQSSNLDWVFI